MTIRYFTSHHYGHYAQLCAQDAANLEANEPALGRPE